LIFIKAYLLFLNQKAKKTKVNFEIVKT